MTRAEISERAAYNRETRRMWRDDIAPMATRWIGPDTIEVASHTDPTVRYVVDVERRTCSRPSRRQPCKHLAGTIDWARAHEAERLPAAPARAFERAARFPREV